ncbi:MAG TPA: bifunctional oligoribonuclease/PAP phosphatase NrnA [Longimicrobiaceae bacterium]|nr:bifunctional oligoribonuclease/PAP phosphatase NrnA [Longimicrobiaceae bacterium]
MTVSMARLLEIPEPRRERLQEVVRRATGARRVVLITHVNSDADGIGSEAAVAAWLESRGTRVSIVNPSPIPEPLRFLVHRRELVLDHAGGSGARAIETADLVLVLDTSEPDRIAPIDRLIDPAKTWVVDHHPPGLAVLGQGGVQDPTAAATGELVYDMITLAGDEWTDESSFATYVALVSDTGSFRFSNTSPRAHAIAADLLAKGIDPEEVFRRLYAVAPMRRLELLREALARLQHDPELGLAWIVLPRDVTDRLGSTADDFDGLIDHARSLQGTRVAMLLRETEDGETKLSLRSSDDTDVNRIARRFGGGGHVKASGATIPLPGHQAVEEVLKAVREEMANGEEGRGTENFEF